MASVLDDPVEGPELTTFKFGIREYELSFSHANHQYRVRSKTAGAKKWEPSKYVPSVTTIIRILDKPGLVNWAANLTATYIFEKLVTKKGTLKAKPDPQKVFELAKTRHSEESKEAGDRGTAAHEHLEKAMANPKKKISIAGPHSDFVREVDKNFRVWAKEVGFKKVLLAETKLYNPELHYSGTMDCLAVLGSGKYIVDFKTGARSYEPEHPAQLAAYLMALEVCFPEHADTRRIGILRFDRDTGRFSWKDYSGVLEEHRALFRGLVETQKLLGLCRSVCKTVSTYEQDLDL